MPTDETENTETPNDAKSDRTEHVVVILADTDWASIKRIATQEFRSRASSWLVFFVNQTNAGGTGSAAGRVGDTAFLAERAGATSVIGDYDTVVKTIRDHNETLTRVLVIRGEGFLGEIRGWLYQKRLRNSFRNINVRSVGVRNAFVSFSLSSAENRKSAGQVMFETLGVLSIVSVCAGLSWLLRDHTPVGFSMLLLLTSVVVAASAFGRWAGIFAAAVSMLTLKSFFFGSVGSISIGSVQDVLLLLIFLVVGGAMSLLTGRSADRLKVARERQMFSESMFRMARKLTESKSFDEISMHLSSELGEPLNATVNLLDCRNGEKPGVEALATLIGNDPMPDDVRALQYAIDAGEPAGYGTSVANETIFHFQPVAVNRTIEAAIVVTDVGEKELNDPKLRVLIESVADLCGIALERLFAEEEIKEAKANEASERLRATVLASLSHDFRTPLSTIIGSTTSLQQFRKKYDAETVEELLSNIYSAASQLDRFVGEVLELSTLQDKDIVSDGDPVDLIDIVETAVETLQPVLSNFRISQKFDHPVPLVAGDPLLLEKVLQNFLENATKYAAADSEITISLQKSDDEVLLSIADTGVGVAPENLQRIFERSFRVSTAPSEDRSAGLGLAICTEIARLHNGRVWAESDGLGKGTTFFFALPIGNIVNFESTEAIA